MTQFAFCARQTDIVVYDKKDVHIDEYNGKWTISGSGLVGYQTQPSLKHYAGGVKLVVRLLLVLFIQTPENERLLIDLMSISEAEVAVMLGMATDTQDNKKSFLEHKWSVDPAAFVSRMSEFTAKVNEDLVELNLSCADINDPATSVLAIYISKTSALRAIYILSNTLSAHNTMKILKSICVNSSINVMNLDSSGIDISKSKDLISLFINVAKTRLWTMGYWCFSASSSLWPVDIVRQIANEVSQSPQKIGTNTSCWFNGYSFEIRRLSNLNRVSSIEPLPRVLVYNDDCEDAALYHVEGNYIFPLEARYNRLVFNTGWRALPSPTERMRRVVSHDQKDIGKIVDFCMQFENLKVLNIW